MLFTNFCESFDGPPFHSDGGPSLSYENILDLEMAIQFRYLASITISERSDS